MVLEKYFHLSFPEIHSSLVQESDFSLNSQLATKTLYHLFYSQQKYSDARNVLVIMQKNNKNRTFVSKEMKKIKSKVK